MTFQSSLLSILIFLPIVGALVVLFLPRGRVDVVRWTALSIAALEFVLALILLSLYSQVVDSVFNTSPFLEKISWIPALGIDYSLNADGISVLLVILTTLLSLICIAASFRIDNKVNNYMGFMLLLEAGMLGVFLASNLFLFYIFWELMLIPAYFLVGSYGGERRIYAALKFVLFTSVGSLLMLAGIIGLSYYAKVASGNYTLDLDTLRTITTHLDPTVQLWLFLAFAIAFAVKVPLFPFHSWLPDAYTQAPAPVTALLAGAMAKTGAYGFIRFCIPLFPSAAQSMAPIINILAIVGILYCALLALVQTDLKRLVAYSSISHLGVIMLGLFAFSRQGVIGSVLQMVNHGITIAALFIIAGLIEEHTGTRRLSDFGGLARKMPVLATLTLIASLSSLGLPGLNSFSGEFLALLGAFRGNAVFGVLGTLVIIPAAWYMLRFFQGVMQGPLQSEGHIGALIRKNGLRDIAMSDFVILLPLVILIFYIGLHPAPLTYLVNSTVTNVMQTFGNAFLS
ncbi:MAG TPA: NADH-quinone oxidoreductase subunit M [Ktedonobacteraceae bacterium]|jgi:NADH-quinone oxidoreductase subunit M|nr:NADH-quinone oxidoreductase subunit M [Ktedonobacteraceae bacterium]